MAIISLSSIDQSSLMNYDPQGRVSNIDIAGTVTTDALVTYVKVDGRFTSRHGFSSRNIHATNVGQWVISGSLSDSGIAPADADASWVVIKALGDITANNGTDSFTIVNSMWSWFKVEIKSKVAVTPATIQLWHRGLI